MTLAQHKHLLPILLLIKTIARVSIVVKLSGERHFTVISFRRQVNNYSFGCGIMYVQPLCNRIFYFKL